MGYPIKGNPLEGLTGAENIGQVDVGKVHDFADSANDDQSVDESLGKYIFISN